MGSDSDKGETPQQSKETAVEKKDSKKMSKKARKKKIEAKMRRLAESVGVEDNDNYPKFKDKEKLVINLSNCKYFIIKFVAKSLFNFKCTYKN